jgi:hypothetical protein
LTTHSDEVFYEVIPSMMYVSSATAPYTLYGFVPTLITLQFAAFGWRMNREINHGEGSHAKWMPIPDVLNIVSLAATVIFLIVLPIATGQLTMPSRIVLGIGYVLIAYHPFTVSAHYCLWRKQDRDRYLSEGKSHAYASSEELVLSALSIVSAISAGAFIGTH